MTGDPKQTLGYIALQLKSQKQQADQALARQKDAQQQQFDQKNKEMSVNTINDAFKQYNASEDRKVQVAGLMQRSAENVELRRYLGDMANKTKRDAENGRNEDRDRDAAEKAKEFSQTFGQKLDEFGEKHNQNWIKNNQKDYEDITSRNANIAKVRGGADVRGVTPEGLLYTDEAVPGSGTHPSGQQPDEPANIPAARPGKVRDEPADQKTIDAAIKAYGEGSRTDKQYDRLQKAMEGVREGDYGGANEDTFIGVPKGIPGVGGFGVNIPGNNKLESKGVDWGLDKSHAGRKLLQFFKGEAEKEDPGEGAIRNRVMARDEAASAAKDLSSQIGLERLGTTSTVKQDEKIDAILGMAGDAAFGRDKKRTQETVKSMRVAHAKIRAVNKYIMEHHAIPLEDLPDESPTASVDPARSNTSSQTGSPSARPTPKTLKDLLMGDSGASEAAPIVSRSAIDRAQAHFDAPDELTEVARSSVNTDPEAREMYQNLKEAGVSDADALEQLRQFMVNKIQKTGNIPF